MPDFFDRLIARGAQRPGGGMTSSSQPDRRAGAASGPPPITLALPRLPGPFERLAAEPSDTFFEVIDESRQADGAPPGSARARPALGRLAGARPAILSPPLAGGPITAPAASPATPRPAGPSPAGPARAHPAPLLPRATPAGLVAGAAVTAAGPASVQASASAGGGDQERGSSAGRAGRAEHPIGPSSPPRPLVVPASAVHAARPAADAARTAAAQPAAPPPVVVRIGRIEVRDTSPGRRERPARRKPGRAAPRLTLAQYLAAASGGRNGGWPGGGR
ncbi:MAG TPA: hypothetical protein VMG38_24950 [Trebonia sp.]|nr:hypothetical protein [Trebonia sp.]